jgi:hypothetical protein
MNDEIKKQIKAIVLEAQTKVDKLTTGLRVAIFEAPRTETDIHTDVAQALRDRQNEGLDASNYNCSDAALTLDGASREERSLVEAALRDLSAVEGLEK